MSAHPSTHVVLHMVLVMQEEDNHAEETTRLHDQLVKHGVDSKSFKWEVSTRNAAFRPGVKMVNIEFQIGYAHLGAVAQILSTLAIEPNVPNLPTQGKYQLFELQDCWKCHAQRGTCCRSFTCPQLQPVLECHIKLWCDMCGASAGTTCARDGCTNVRVWTGALVKEQRPPLEKL